MHDPTRNQEVKYSIDTLLKNKCKNISPSGKYIFKKMVTYLSYKCLWVQRCIPFRCVCARSTKAGDFAYVPYATSYPLLRIYKSSIPSPTQFLHTREDSIRLQWRRAEDGLWNTHLHPHLEEQLQNRQVTFFLLPVVVDVYLTQVTHKQYHKQGVTVSI